MKKIVLGLICATLTAACGSRNLISVQQVTEPIQIDGEISDWIDAEAPFFIKENIRYAFTDDEEYLYVLVEAKQQTDIMKMAGLGFTIWFNERGKKKKSVGIRYPVGTMEMGNGMPPGGTSGAFGNAGMEMNGPEMYDMFLQDLDVLRLVGFEVEEEIFVEVAEEDYGIKVKAVFTDDGLFINEFAVPKKLVLTKEKSKKLAVGFFTDEMERPSFAGGPGGMGGGMQPPGGGMGGMGGGMSPGGMPPGGRSGFQDMLNPIEIWTVLDMSKE